MFQFLPEIDGNLNAEKNEKWIQEGEYELWESVKKWGKYSKVTPKLIDHLNEWIGNHSQVVNSPMKHFWSLI